MMIALALVMFWVAGVGFTWGFMCVSRDEEPRWWSTLITWPVDLGFEVARMLKARSKPSESSP